MVATPMTYFAAFQLKTDCAVMITGSHNPPDYNGLKMVLAGETLSGETIQKLRQRIEQNDLAHGTGSYSQYDIAPEYLARIIGDIKLARPLNITVDCGNGVAGDFAAKLYRGIGCKVTEMFCEVDGNFPNHHPDPSDPHNLRRPDRRLARQRQRTGTGVRRRWRPLGRGHQGRQDHLPRPPVDAVRRRCVEPQCGRGDHLRREVHAQSVRLDTRTRRQAHAVEDRPLAGESQDARDRRLAGRRDERPCVLQGTLVRL